MWPKNSVNFITDSQKTAWESGDAKAIKAADDAALAQAVLASLAEHEVSQTVDDPVTEDDLINEAIEESLKPNEKTDAAENRRHYDDLQSRKTDGLRKWFRLHGFDIVRNGGGAANNCLLISLLQHITGDYRSEHAADVNKYRQQLMAWDKSIKQYDPLPSTGNLIMRLIDLIIKDKKSERRIAIAAPGVGDSPTYHFYGRGPDYAIILDQSGHYEAAVPRGSGPEETQRG